MTEPEPVVSVAVPAAQGALDGAWRLLLALANDSSAPRWVLIGGLLVELHAHEHGVAPPRLTADADVLVDVRTSPSGVPILARWLLEGSSSTSKSSRRSNTSGRRGRGGQDVEPAKTLQLVDVVQGRLDGHA